MTFRERGEDRRGRACRTKLKTNCGNDYSCRRCKQNTRPAKKVQEGKGIWDKQGERYANDNNGKMAKLFETKYKRAYTFYVCPLGN